MWLSEKVSENAGAYESFAEIGRVTIGGTAAAAVSGSEKRGLTVVSPGGLEWCPATGRDVLIVKTGDGESLIAGELLPGGDSGLLAGEVRISAQGGAEIYLKSDGCLLVKGDVMLDGKADIKGDISINGDVNITGRLFLNGAQIFPSLGL